MPITLNGDTGIQTPMYNGTITANAVTPSVNMKSRIINGAMTIDQRNAGAAVTPTATTYTLDRWIFQCTQASKITVQQNAGSVTPPVGFSNYLGCTVASTATVGSSDGFIVQQIIEGFNTADLNWGTANAKTITVSAWVRSSVTGTFGGCLYNGTYSRGYPFTYTISSANTWTQISVTIAGDTSGTWATNNTAGIGVIFSLGAGSSNSGTAGAWAASGYLSATGATSIMGTNGATFYITGVQLEVGSTATSFDYRPYGTELALCQRYYYQENYATGTYPFMLTAYNTTSVYGFVTKFPVTMRAVPTMSSSGSFQPLQKDSTGAGTVASITGLTSYTNIGCQSGGITGLSGLVAGDCSVIYVNATSNLSASAEL